MNKNKENKCAELYKTYLKCKKQKNNNLPICKTILHDYYEFCFKSYLNYDINNNISVNTINQKVKSDD